MKLNFGLLGALLVCAAPAFAQDATVEMAPAQIAQNTAKIDGPRNPITDDQRKRLSALREQYILDTAQPKAELKVSQHKLREALRSDTVDKQAALSLQTKINGLRASLADARLKMMLASSDVFTPEQRAEMKKFCGFKHGKHFRGGRGGHCGPGGCGSGGGGFRGGRGPRGIGFEVTPVGPGAIGFEMPVDGPELDGPAPGPLSMGEEIELDLAFMPAAPPVEDIVFANADE